MDDFINRIAWFRILASLAVWTILAFVAFAKALEDGSKIAIGVVCFIGTFPFIALFFWLLDRKMKSSESKKKGLYSSAASAARKKNSIRRK